MWRVFVVTESKPIPLPLQKLTSTSSVPKKLKKPITMTSPNKSDSVSSLLTSSNNSDLKIPESSLIMFNTGNPMVELIEGVVHLFRERNIKDLKRSGTLEEETEDYPEEVFSNLDLFLKFKEERKKQLRDSIQRPPDRGNLLLVLAVPKYMTPGDFVTFLGSLADKLVNVKVLRDSSPNKYMIMLQTQDRESADQIFEEFNARQFSTMGPETCTLLYVHSIELFPPNKEKPFFPVEKFKENTETNSSQMLCEMPTCPVCLERLDENNSGILTILCNHAFHCQCLMKWKGGNVCPVCRYSQQPESPSSCSVCGTENSLWICLICGNVGCGRYVNEHARDHFKRTGHTYAMECNTSLVWDYASEEFVHRIVQSKSGGGLIALPSPEKSLMRDMSNSLNLSSPFQFNPPSDLSKVESVAMEYQLLLEKQSQHFLEEMRRIEREKGLKIRHLEQEYAELFGLEKALEQKIKRFEEEKKEWTKKIELIKQQMKDTEQKSKFYQEINLSLELNQKDWQEKVIETEMKLRNTFDQKDEKIRELEEQIKDLMFFIEHREKIEKNPELQHGEVVLKPVSTPPLKKTLSKPSKKNKKR